MRVAKSFYKFKINALSTKNREKNKRKLIASMLVNTLQVKLLNNVANWRQKAGVARVFRTWAENCKLQMAIESQTSKSKKIVNEL